MQGDETACAPKEIVTDRKTKQVYTFQLRTCVSLLSIEKKWLIFQKCNIVSCSFVGLNGIKPHLHSVFCSCFVSKITPNT